MGWLELAGDPELLPLAGPAAVELGPPARAAVARSTRCSAAARSPATSSATARARAVGRDRRAATRSCASEPVAYGDALGVHRVLERQPDRRGERSVAFAAWTAASTGYLAGLSEWALGVALEHAQGRSAFGATLAALAPVQQRLADAATATRGLRAARRRAAGPRPRSPTRAPRRSRSRPRASRSSARSASRSSSRSSAPTAAPARRAAVGGRAAHATVALTLARPASACTSRVARSSGSAGSPASTRTPTPSIAASRTSVARVDVVDRELAARHALRRSRAANHVVQPRVELVGDVLQARVADRAQPQLHPQHPLALEPPGQRQAVLDHAAPAAARTTCPAPARSAVRAAPARA